LPQVSAAQELQIKAEIRLAALIEEKLVTRISVLSTLLGGGKKPNDFSSAFRLKRTKCRRTSINDRGQSEK
jgi:hypothetical protein